MTVVRRDFINGVLAGASVAAGGAAIAGCPASAVAQGLGDAWTGYAGTGDYARSNGNTAEVVNAAHRVRDDRYEGRIATAAPRDGVYDMVVVGGGFAGLAAAYEFVKRRPSGTVLLLENHRVPGGEAKQNEIVVDGVRLIGPQGSNDVAIPRPNDDLGYDYWTELGMPMSFSFAEPSGAAAGIKVAKDNYEAMFWKEDVANIGWFFDGTVAGTHRAMVVDPFRDRLARAPLDARTRRDWLTWHDARRSYAPPAGMPVDRWLDSMSYGAFMTDVMKLGPSIAHLADPLCAAGDYGASADAISAYAAKLLGLPGPAGADIAHGLNEYEIFSFPGGNAALARHFVKALVPQSIAGRRTFADIALAPFRFDAFDRPGARCRIRLGATAVAVNHEGPPERASHVRVVYARSGQLERVRARTVVMATGGWITKHVVRDLPTSYRQAYEQFHHGPVLVANVALRNWRAMAKLGISGARWFDGLGFFANVKRPMTLDGFAPPLDPDRPVMLNLYIGFPIAGMPVEEQTVVARTRLFATSYAQYEGEIRAKLRALFGSAGFDDRRDVAGIVLNRWGHAYIAPQPGFYFARDGGAGPLQVPRSRFGRIAFGHSELSGRQNWIRGAHEGRRAAQQAIAVL